MKQRKRYLLFDMAGTVFASSIDWERENRAGAVSLVDWLKDQGRVVKDEAALVEGLLAEGRKLRSRAKQERVEYKLSDLLKKVLARFGHTLDKKKFKQAELIYLGPELALTRPFSEAFRILKRFKQEGFKLVLLSNTPAEEFVLTSLKRYKMSDLFDEVIISAQVGYRKPHPNFLEYVQKKIAFDRQATVLIGDRLYDDIGSAKALGIAGVLFAADRHSDNRPYEQQIIPEATVDNFQELYKVVKSLV